MILWQIPGTWNKETQRAWYDQTKWLLMPLNRQVHYSNIQHRFDSFARFGTLPNRKSALKALIISTNSHFTDFLTYRA
jgi:hypothetical protein